MRDLLRVCMVAGAVAVAAACQTTKVEKVARAVAVDQEAVLTDGQAPRPVQLIAVETGVRRGQKVGTMLSRCGGFGVTVPITWRLGKSRYNSPEIKALFHDELEGHDIPVLGSTGSFFAEASEDFAPDYVIGVTLNDVSYNLCREHDFWTGIATGVVTGEGAATFKWEVLDRYTRKIVYTGETKGFAEVAGVNEADSSLVILEDAMAMAANNLAAQPEFVRAISKRTDFEDIAALEEPVIRIEDLPLFETPMRDQVDRVKLATVLFDLGQGHGSGFVISRDGLVLTNHHVAGKERFVRVRLATGRTVVGEVLRAHEERDTALVKIEGDGYIALPIRTEPVAESETVFAVGAPLDTALQTTVSQGVVSAYRQNRYGLQDIQADVDIHGGNSGGPLLDENGNIVGQTYAGIQPAGDGTSVGLNLFNPIMDVMDKLQIEIDPRITDSSVTNPLGS